MAPIQSNPLNPQEDHSVVDPPAPTPGWILQSGPWLGLLAIILTFILFAKMTWMHWGSLRVDCGREMYVPQEIARGKMLFRDLWYPYGPLVPYWNGWLFRIFGEHLAVLYACGLAVTLSMALTLFAVSRRFLSTFASYVVTLCFLLQAFRSHLFNYILPYSYAATIGSLFSLLCLYFLLRHMAQEFGPNLRLAGVAAGLALTTKTEYGLACYLTLAFFQTTQTISNKSFAAWFRGISSLIPGALIPAAVYGYFFTRLSITFFRWDAFSREWYVNWSRRTGFRFIPSEVLERSLYVLLALVVWWFLAFILQKTVLRRWPSAFYQVLLFGLLLWAVYLKWGAFTALFLHFFLVYVFFPSGIFWLGCACFLWVLVRWWRQGFSMVDLALAVLCFYALATGARIMAHVEPFNYSIYYNMPLFLVYLIVLLRVIRHAGFRILPELKPKLAVAVLLISGIGLVTALYPWRFMTSSLLATDRGDIYCQPLEAATFPSIIQFIQEKQARGEHVLIMPEETSLYFLAGVDAPSRWYMLHPGVLGTKEKERDYIASLETYGVDYVLFSNRSNREYGYPFFGLDYDRLVYQWLEENFEVTGEFGHFSRQKPEEFGMLLYQRRGRVKSTVSPP